MAREKKGDTKRPIESYEHRDKQHVNNPPVALRRFASSAGAGPVDRRGRRCRAGRWRPHGGAVLRAAPRRAMWWQREATSTTFC